MEGSKRVEITGLDDGEFLTVQLVYQGKTSQCHPSYRFPDDWHVTHSPNHWCNEETMKDYITKILVPEKRKQLGLSVRHRALVIRAQCTPAILALLEENDIDIVTVPANCTDRLHVSVKDFLRDQFHKWYAEQIQKQMSDDVLVKELVDLRLSIIKPIAAKWFVNLYDYLVSKPDIIKNGCKGAGITTELFSY